MTHRSTTAFAALLLAACKPATPIAPDISVRDGWARETAPGQTSGAAYVTIVSRGSAGDRLVGVTTPAASSAMLHASSESGGVMSMRMAKEVAVPGGATVALKPLGTHIMLTGLTAPLKTGDRVSLTLRFARAGERQVDAAVLAASASGPTR
ncbi:MAG: copper chaperone PCu(A)C [Sphingomicrobium sp.]